MNVGGVEWESDERKEWNSVKGNGETARAASSRGKADFVSSQYEQAFETFRTYYSWLTQVTEVLERHDIEMIRTEEPIRAIMESYRIESVRQGEMEDKEYLNVGVSMTRNPGMIFDGEVIVWARGLQRNLIVTLLEPQSQWGLLPLRDFYGIRDVGSFYPIRRIMEVMD